MAVVASQVEPGPGRSDGLEIRLLGPVALEVAGHEVGIGSPKQRVILAMLALSPRVTVDAIADALWRDTPPASVAATVHTLVSRLRRTLQEAGGGITIRSEGAGYVLDVESERVDVNRFEAAVSAGRRCLAEGATAEAARWLREALSLWRGPALDDLSDRDFARMAATRLDEARLRAAEELAEAELAGGAPAAALEVIEPLIARYPFHERLRRQEMLALYRLGRQADALAAFQDLRRCLVAELGLEPAPALVALERQILLQDAELDLALAPRSRPARPSGDPPALAGTLAFLFTDIESSTSRWESDRAAMAADLAQHDELLGGAVAAHGGRRFTHTGDGLGAAFPTAASAIAAAVAGQVALAGATWSGVAPLRVRMGVHAGAAEARAGTFLGPTLNRAARLLDVARGGEILCSQAAADLAHDDLPPEATLVGRGERRLRGLSRPETVWQVVHPALAGVVPPAEPEPTLASPEASLTSFIGRERELAELSALLGEARLVTITGVGGAGKTRLALELTAHCGRAYPDGATVVELAPVGDDRPLAGVVLTALGLDAGGPSADAAEQRLAEALAEQQLLLVLDNCEHLIQPVAALVQRLLLHCPALTVLTTSREALSVPGETTWAAPGLSLPPEDASLPADLEGSDAAALFVARARQTNPGFGVTSKNVAALTAICHRLDGIPLALELAAARVRALGVVQLAEHLDDRFRLLTDGPPSGPPRHQTLAAALDWSYEALTEPEQRLLRRLAVFPQRFDLPAATAVAGEGKDELDVLPLLGRLVDKSLLVAEGAAETARYRLLETVREYGARKLTAAGEDAKTAVLHRNHFVGLIADWNRRGENFFATEWMLRAAANTENFHAALVNALAASDTEAVTVLVAGLWKQWYLSGSVPPAVSSIEPGMIGCADPTLHIDALIGFSVVPKMAESTLTIRDLVPLGERALMVADTHGSRLDQGWARHWVAYFARSRGDVGAARALMAEALDLFTKERSAFELSYIHYELGWVAMAEGDLGSAIEHFRFGVAFSDEVTGYEMSALQLQADRKSTRLNSSHTLASRMPSSA